MKLHDGYIYWVIFIYKQDGWKFTGMMGNKIQCRDT